MPKIYHRLYDAAKLDSKSAQILNKNGVYAPAIYHCAQAVQKCLKSTHGYYLMKIEKKSEYEVDNKFYSKSYGHKLRVSYEEIMKLLLTIYIEIDLKPDNKKEAYQKLRNTIKIQELDIPKTVRQFDELVDILYENYIKTIKGNVDGMDEDLALRTREFLNQPYFKFIIVVMRLSAFLTPFEMYSRYPMRALSYNNISLLNNAKNKLAINHVCYMIDEALNLVPLVWKQIDFFRNKK